MITSHAPTRGTPRQHTSHRVYRVTSRRVARPRWRPVPRPELSPEPAPPPAPPRPREPGTITDPETGLIVKKGTPMEAALFAEDHQSTSLRGWIRSLPSAFSFMFAWNYQRPLDDHLMIFDYACRHPGRRKKVPVTPEKMTASVALWTDTVIGLISAHTREEWDRYDFKTDDLIAPFLTAPVKDIRTFVDRLAQSLKADPRCPFWVWRQFENFAESLIKKAPDGKIQELRKAQAQRIAAAVDGDLRPQLAAAVEGALMWRPQEQLDRVEKAVASGGKPTLRGRESCLFMDVMTPDGESSATVML